MRFSIMEIKKLPGDYLLTIMDWHSSTMITLTTTEANALNNETDAELTLYINNFLNDKKHEQ